MVEKKTLERANAKGQWDQFVWIKKDTMCRTTARALSLKVRPRMMFTCGVQSDAVPRVTGRGARTFCKCAQAHSAFNMCPAIWSLSDRSLAESLGLWCNYSRAVLVAGSSAAPMRLVTAPSWSENLFVSSCITADMPLTGPTNTLGRASLSGAIGTIFRSSRATDVCLICALLGTASRVHVRRRYRSCRHPFSIYISPICADIICSY